MYANYNTLLTNVQLDLEIPDTEGWQQCFSSRTQVIPGGWYLYQRWTKEYYERKYGRLIRAGIE